MLDRLRRLFTREHPEHLPAVTMEPIGVVCNGIKDTGRHDWQGVPSRIVLRPDMADALLGLSDYSHIIVLFWLHAVPPEARGSKHRLHPRDDPQNPLQGVLATRSQIRFNPLGFTVVRLLRVKDNVLHVRGLDAIDGTPVFDIKPYIAPYDAVPDARFPDWLKGVGQRSS